MSVKRKREEYYLAGEVCNTLGSGSCKQQSACVWANGRKVRSYCRSVSKKYLIPVADLQGRPRRIVHHLCTRNYRKASGACKHTCYVKEDHTWQRVPATSGYTEVETTPNAPVPQREYIVYWDPETKTFRGHDVNIANCTSPEDIINTAKHTYKMEVRGYNPSQKMTFDLSTTPLSQVPAVILGKLNSAPSWVVPTSVDSALLFGGHTIDVAMREMQKISTVRQLNLTDDPTITHMSTSPAPVVVRRAS